MKRPCVYILTNKGNTVLYIGVTSNLLNRIYQHKEGLYEGFTKRYACKILVYFEFHQEMKLAIIREKQLKNFSRNRKMELINDFNPSWRDLYSEISF